MDILAIREKIVSAVICQLQWRDRIATDKSTKRGGPKCWSAQEGKGKGVGLKWEGRRKGPFTCPCYPHLQGLFWPRRVCPSDQVVDIWLTSSNRLQTILLFSALNMVSLGKSVKVGDERSTCAVPTIKFHDVSLNWRPRRHNPTQTCLHAPPPHPPWDLPLRAGSSFEADPVKKIYTAVFFQDL